MQTESKRLGLSSVVAVADELTAARAACAVFFPHGRGQVHVDHIGNGSEPGQHISKFRGLLLFRAFPQRRGQLAYLFHQPHECPVDAAGQILFEIHPPDERLEIREREGSRFLSHWLPPKWWADCGHRQLTCCIRGLSIILAGSVGTAHR